MYYELEKRTAKTKNDLNIVLQLSVDEDNEKYHQIKAFIQENKIAKEIGSAYFSFFNSTAFLSKIAVTDPSYHSIGVGSAILNYFEDICKRRLVNQIEGKFYPEGFGAEHAKGFYLKHGYDIEKDGYETMIYKNVQQINKKR